MLMFVINATTLLTLVMCVFHPFLFFIAVTRALSKLFLFLKIWIGLVSILCWLSISLVYATIIICLLQLSLTLFCLLNAQSPSGKSGPIRLCILAWEFFTILFALQYLQTAVFKCWKSLAFPVVGWENINLHKLSGPLLPKVEISNYLFLTFFQWVTLLFFWKMPQWCLDRVEFCN